MRLVVTKRTIDATILRGNGDPAGTLCQDTYRERLIKYVPVETIALYIAVYGITYYVYGSEPWYPLAARWILLAGIAGTLLYLWRVEGVTDWVQLVISGFGFVIWVCALGVITVTSLPLYNALPAGLLLPVWVFGAPFIEGRPACW